MNIWEEAILKSLDSLGGEADLQEIYKRLPDFIELSKEHLKPTKWGGRPAYEYQVRSHITNLCQAGQLVRVGMNRIPARYSLTEHGRRRIIGV